VREGAIIKVEGIFSRRGGKVAFAFISRLSSPRDEADELGTRCCPGGEGRVSGIKEKHRRKESNTKTA